MAAKKRAKKNPVGRPSLGERESLTIRLSPRQLDDLRGLADARGTSLNATISDALDAGADALYAERAR